MSILGILNFVLLQWFTLRLTKVIQVSAVSVGYRVTVDEARVAHASQWVPHSISVVRRPGDVRWRLMHGIAPLTGWWSSYRRLW
jgi:hypothetical protein